MGLLKIALNPDEEFVARMRKAVKDNDGYCPCEFTKTPDTKCMCKAFRDKQDVGYCHCRLYLKTYKEE